MTSTKVALMVIELDDGCFFLMHAETRCYLACQMAAAKGAVPPWIDLM
ncbi:MAG TPA: hypothetical protein VI037_07840 [Nitrososphaera sp.]